MSSGVAFTAFSTLRLSVSSFGDDYVNGLLNYIKENGNTLDVDKKQLMYVSLENDLNRQLLADPDNLTLASCHD